MPTLTIMSVIGTAVPARLRDMGVLACWYLVQDGIAVSGPLISLPQAKAAYQSYASLRA